MRIHAQYTIYTYLLHFVYCQSVSWRKTKYVLTSRFMNRSVCCIAIILLFSTSGLRAMSFEFWQP